MTNTMRYRIGWAFALAVAWSAGAPLAGALGVPVRAALAAQDDRKCKDRDGGCSERDRERQRAEVERLRRQIERQIAQALKTLDNQEDSLDTRTLRVTREQLTQAIRALETTRLRLEAQEAAAADEEEGDGTSRRIIITRGGTGTGGRVRKPMAPQPPQTPQPAQPGRRTGWLGVSLSSAADAVGSADGRRLFQFRSYPMVESVEPASPARRAGLRSGDVLLAFDGIDLKKNTVPLDEMLRPGSRLPIRMRRDGETRDVTVIVGQRPQGYESPTPPPPPRREPEVVVVPRVRVSPAPAPPAPSDDRPPGFVPFTMYRTTTTPIAGCELTRISGDMGDYFGVDAGLLVLSVAPGTPASRAGLRTGDVIVAANGEDIESVRELSDAIAGDGTRHAVKLDVVRKKERLTLTLR